MSEKRKEKKLLNALTLILDLCCKEDVERSGKTKKQHPSGKRVLQYIQKLWKDQNMEKRDSRGGRVQTNTRLEVKSSRLGSRGLRVNC